MNPYLIIGALLGAIGLTAGGYVAGHHVEELAFNAYKADQAAVAEKAAAQSEAAARSKEQQQEAAQSAAQHQAQVEKTENANRTDALVAQLRAGTLRLSNELASARADGVPQAASSASGADEDRNGYISNDVAQFLVDQAARADKLAVNFNEAVAVIAADRQTCNGANP